MLDLERTIERHRRLMKASMACEVALIGLMVLLIALLMVG